MISRLFQLKLSYDEAGALENQNKENRQGKLKVE